MNLFSFGDVEKKTISFFIGAILVVLGITKTFQIEWISLVIILIGVYLTIKGLE